MISKRERAAFKKILGNHYTDNVTEVLIKNEVKDTFGKTHSPQMIRQVFNGVRNHEEIELAIIKAVELKQVFNNELEEKKQSILKSA